MIDKGIRASPASASSASTHNSGTFTSALFSRVYGSDLSGILCASSPVLRPSLLHRLKLKLQIHFSRRNKTLCDKTPTTDSVRHPPVVAAPAGTHLPLRRCYRVVEDTGIEFVHVYAVCGLPIFSSQALLVMPKGLYFLRQCHFQAFCQLVCLFLF